MSLANYANNCCPTEFANGSDGQLMVMSGGNPVWGKPSDVAITDAGGYFTTDNVEAALQQLASVSGTCEAVQDCIGTAIGPAKSNTGLTYDDANGIIKFDAAELPSQSGSTTGVVVTTSGQPAGTTLTLSQLVSSLCPSIRSSCFTGGVGVDLDTSTGDLTFDATELTAAAACATPTTFVGGDNLLYNWANNYPGFQYVQGNAPFFVLSNPAASVGIQQVPGSVTTTVTLTNNHACKDMNLFYWLNAPLDFPTGGVSGNRWVLYSYIEIVVAAAVVASFHARANIDAFTNGGQNWDNASGVISYFANTGVVLTPGQTATINFQRRYLTVNYVANAANRIGYEVANFGAFGMAI